MTFDEIYACTQNLSILYVEDEKDIRESTTRLLENYFKRVDVAKDGKEGLKYYTNSLQNNPYDIVLSDINMPDLDGLEMFKKIRELRANQTVVLVTAHREEEFAAEAIMLGVDDFLFKPVKLDELAKVIFHTAQSLADKDKTNK